VLPLALCPACATNTPEPGTRVQLVQAQREIPEKQLLDVGIQVFNPGLPTEEDAELPPGVFPEIRKSEARYFAVLLKETMQQTGQWGAVRVLPTAPTTANLAVFGTIIESTGKKLVLEIRAVDASGRAWLQERYKGLADAASFAEPKAEDRDPFQDLFNLIANDLVKERERLDARDIASLREIAELKFAADLVPAAFSEYIATTPRGRTEVVRLPATDDPMVARVASVRSREHMFVDTLNQHYDNFFAEMEEPYNSWRHYSYEEQMALDALRRKARTQKIVGAIALLGAIFAQVDSGAEAAIRDAAAFGGMAAIQAGIATSKEAKIHVEALRELGVSFEAEVEPMVVEVEGQTLRLTGSIETQYESWRRLLREIYMTETGFPIDPNAESELPAVGAPGG
jgi:hypothetical protein